MLGGNFFIALSCFCTLGHGEASGERISLRLRCKKSEEREGRKRTGKGRVQKGCKSGEQKWLEEVRGSWVLEVMDKNLSLEGNINIVL